MNDILPEEARRWQRLESAFRDHVHLYGYGEVRLPILEHTALFTRQIGETTDVVEKEMYSFERHGDELTVRPEGTAGAARAYVEHKLHTREPVTRWYYLGPMFRGERPAKGRYRQFYQAGCELYGDPGPLADAEMIELLASFLHKIGITAITVHLNSIGSGDTRTRYRQALLTHFKPMQDRLSEDSQRRLEKNPLRILDSKDPKDREAAATAPSILDILSEQDAAHFQGVCRSLDTLGISHVVDPTLVRGLDYYTRTLFELRTSTADLGAQNALVGGGRYDHMVESLGGPDVPAIGFAMGLERVLATMPKAEQAVVPDCYLLPLTDKGADQALVLARELRALSVHAQIDGRGGRLKAMLRRADALGAKLCVIFGESEIERGVVAVKDLAGRTQQELPIGEAARALSEQLARIAAGAAGNTGGTR